MLSCDLLLADIGRVPAVLKCVWLSRSDFDVSSKFDFISMAWTMVASMACAIWCFYGLDHVIASACLCVVSMLASVIQLWTTTDGVITFNEHYL
jgi:membrane protein YdbS with pleckstrin-like domain